MCFLGTFVLYLHFFRINSLFFVDYACLVLSICFEPGLFEVKADVVSSAMCLKSIFLYSCLSDVCILP